MAVAVHRLRPSTSLLVLIAGASVALGYLGSVLGPALIADHPAVLLGLDSRSRHLVMAVAVGISPLAYGAVAAVRLTVADPAFFELGRRHGDRLPAALERRLPMVAFSLPAAARVMERIGPVAVFLAPNAAISALAGMTGMPVRRYTLLNLTGTATRLLALWLLARRFDDASLAIASWSSSNRVMLAAVASFVVGAQLTRSLRRSTVTTVPEARAAEAPRVQ